MACPGGCIGGGGQPYGVNGDVRAKRAAGLYQHDRDRRLRFSHENPEVKRVYDEFLEPAAEPQGPRTAAHALHRPAALQTVTGAFLTALFFAGNAVCARRAALHYGGTTGNNLSMLIVQCGSAVAAALIEWFWLGSRLSPAQAALAVLTLARVAVAR